MTKTELDAIKARVLAATPGEWKHADDTVREDGTIQSANVLIVDEWGVDPWQVAAAYAGSIMPGPEADAQAVANARFIAHAKQDVLALVEALETARGDALEEAAKLAEVDAPGSALTEAYWFPIVHDVGTRIAANLRALAQR